MFKKIIFALCFFAGVACFISDAFAEDLSPSSEEGLSHHVLVSVAPYKYFVEQIAGDTVSIGVMVPAAASIHTYEPTPKEMVAASKADAWFFIGEAFESKAIEALKNHHPSIKLYDLRNGVDLIQSQCHHHHHHKGCMHGADLHIWLSPKEAKKQAVDIAKGLMEVYPRHKDLYKANLEKFLVQLDELNAYIAGLMRTVSPRTIMVSHPAYGYFCRDYDLQQVSIEFEGKDPTPQQLTRVLNVARKDNIHTIYIQKQYNNKGAKLIADYLGAAIVNLDPYSEDYVESLRYIARQFASPHEKK